MGYRQGGKATSTRTSDRTQVSVPNIFLTDEAVVEHCHPNCHAVRDLQQNLAATTVVGDIVIVKPGERITVDGRLTAGATTVDQSPITGESWPVEKLLGDQVLGGTINGMGAFEMSATATANSSATARIVHMIEDAQARRAPTQQFVDRFARTYTPGVFLLGADDAVVSEAHYPKDGAPAGQTYCRLPDLTGELAACAPTPGASNHAP